MYWLTPISSVVPVPGVQEYSTMNVCKWSCDSVYWWHFSYSSKPLKTSLWCGPKWFMLYTEITKELLTYPVHNMINYSVGQQLIYFALSWYTNTITLFTILVLWVTTPNPWCNSVWACQIYAQYWKFVMPVQWSVRTSANNSQTLVTRLWINSIFYASIIRNFRQWLLLYIDIFQIATNRHI